MKKKIIVAIVALVLAIVCAVGGTLAWLFMKTDAIVNTFTYGDINITLTETDADVDGKLNENSYKMVPGNKIAKDPKVTVAEGSEDCWLFIKIEKSSNFDDFMTFEIAGGWNPLAGNPGIYYQEVDAVTTDTDFPVLKGNQVSVKNTVLKTDLNALSATTPPTLPTLTFTAYAVQKANVNSAAEAWEIAVNGGNPVTP